MNSTESVSFDWVHLLNIITWSHWHTLLQVLLWAPCIAQAKWNQNRLSKRIGQIPALTMQWTTEHWPTWWLFVGRFYHTVSHSASPRSDVRWKQNSLNRNQTSNYRGWSSLESIKTYTKLTQPWCFGRCYANGFIWIQFWVQSNQRWNHNWWKRLKISEDENDQILRWWS